MLYYINTDLIVPLERVNGAVREEIFDWNFEAYLMLLIDINCKLYYRELHLKYLCNLARYWLQAAWGWHGSVETCSSVIICEIIVRLLVIVPNIIIDIIIIFLHALGLLTCSSVDALPSFPGASTISSSSRFVVEGVFRKSGVVRSVEMVDPVLFVSGFHVLCSRDL